MKEKKIKIKKKKTDETKFDPVALRATLKRIYDVTQKDKTKIGG